MFSGYRYQESTCCPSNALLLARTAWPSTIRLRSWMSAAGAAFRLSRGSDGDLPAIFVDRDHNMLANIAVSHLPHNALKSGSATAAVLHRDRQEAMHARGHTVEGYPHVVLVHPESA